MMTLVLQNGAKSVSTKKPFSSGKGLLKVEYLITISRKRYFLHVHQT